MKKLIKTVTVKEAVKHLQAGFIVRLYKKASFEHARQAAYCEIEGNGHNEASLAHLLKCEMRDFIEYEKFCKRRVGDISFWLVLEKKSQELSPENN